MTPPASWVLPERPNPRAGEARVSARRLGENGVGNGNRGAKAVRFTETELSGQERTKASRAPERKDTMNAPRKPVALEGFQAIREHLGGRLGPWSPGAVSGWVRAEGLPASRGPDGVWRANPQDLDAWAEQKARGLSVALQVLPRPARR